MPPPRTLALSRHMHTHTHAPLQAEGHGWWAPLQPFPSAAMATPPLAFGHSREPLGSTHGGFPSLQKPPVPALFCQGALARNRPLSLTCCDKTSLSMQRDIRWLTSLALTHSRFGDKDRAQLSPFLPVPRPACPQQVCHQLLLPPPQVKACP